MLLRRMFIPMILASLALGMLAPCRSIARAEAPWAGAQNLSQGGADPQGASLAVDSAGRVHAVWSAEGQLWHRIREGKSWSAAQRVAEGHTPDLAADLAGHVYLAFMARIEGAEDIYYAPWTASGGWGLPSNISETPEISSAPRLAATPQGELAIVWSEAAASGDVVYLARSTDGLTWSSAPVPNARGLRPVVGLGQGDTVWVAWQEPFDEGFPDEVWCSQWTGSRWTLPVDASASPAAASAAPTLVVYQGQAFLAWQEATEEGPRIFSARWDQGAWSSPTQRSSLAAFGPRMAITAPGQGYLAWTTAQAVQVRPWSLLTDTWSPIEDVAAALDGPAEARLAMGAAPHALWLAPDEQSVYHVFYSVRSGGEPGLGRLFLPLIRRP